MFISSPNTIEEDINKLTSQIEHAITDRGGPFTSVAHPGATEFVMLYGYRMGITQNNYGLISAFAMIVFVLLFLLTMVNLRATRITKGAYE